MWQTVGQSKIIELFQRALIQGRLAHAYLMVGPTQVGKMTLARELAMALNCRVEIDRRPCGECVSCRKISAGKHADVMITGLNQAPAPDENKEKTEIGIEQIKDMLRTASLPPFEGEYRVYIIDEAANLSMEAANRLLKTLEEPPEKVTFILLTANAGLIPATVISRCQRLNLSRLKTDDIESLLISRYNTEPEKARLLACLSRGSPGWAIEAAQKTSFLQERSEKMERVIAIIKSAYSERFAAAAQMAQQFGKKREAVYETLDAWTSWWRDLLLVKTGCTGDIINIDYRAALAEMAGAFSLTQMKTAVRYILEAGEQLKLNANSRIVFENLMLSLPTPMGNRAGKQQTGVIDA
ncbi:MAG: DNA polymerase III subunit [Dehalococcoidales bacterium]|nr:DNA polymerase III subunit [Dehalococcoidales bacterium]